MKCKDLRDRLDNLWTGEIPAELRQHLAGCSECARYVRNVRLVRAGFRVMAAETVPEPSLGFAERLVRRIGQAGERAAGGEFFERVGRRFVLATLLMTLILVLALVLPPSGPVRSASATNFFLTEPETVVANANPITGATWQDVSDAVAIPNTLEEENTGR